MERDTLLSLLKSKEVEEQTIVTELVKVTGIMDQRLALVQQANEERDQLRAKVRSLRQTLVRTNASDSELVQTIDDEKRNLEKYDRRQAELEDDLAKAKERVDIAQGQLTAVRMEITRIEKLVEEQRLTTLIKRTAAEEAAIEDAAAGNRKDKWS